MCKAVKEAFSNAAKHACASEVLLRVELRERTLTVSVEDNGVGLGANASRPPGNGLLNMRGRMKDIGGNSRRKLVLAEARASRFE